MSKLNRWRPRWCQNQRISVGKGPINLVSRRKQTYMEKEGKPEAGWATLQLKPRLHPGQEQALRDYSVDYWKKGTVLSGKPNLWCDKWREESPLRKVPGWLKGSTRSTSGATRHVLGGGEGLVTQMWSAPCRAPFTICSFCLAYSIL